MVRKKYYKPYTRIIKERWDRQLRRDIHAAAYWLNPAFQYDKENYCDKAEVLTGLLNLLEKSSSCKSSSKLMNEMKLYRDRLESFSREWAINTAKTTQPGNA